MRIAAVLHGVGRRLRGTVWVCCTAVLTVTNVGLVWQLHEARNQLSRVFQSINVGGLDWVLATDFSSSDARDRILNQARSRYIVVDCYTKFDAPFVATEAQDLNALVGTSKDLSVFGIMAYASQVEASRFAALHDLRYPVLADPDGSHLQSLDLPRTPWKMLFDRKTRTVILQDPPTQGRPDWSQFTDAVRKLTGPRSGF